MRHHVKHPRIGDGEDVAVKIVTFNENFLLEFGPDDIGKEAYLFRGCALVVTQRKSAPCSR